jgi:hypothetical protein
LPPPTAISSSPIPSPIVRNLLQSTATQSAPIPTNGRSSSIPQSTAVSSSPKPSQSIAIRDPPLPATGVVNQLTSSILPREGPISECNIEDINVNDPYLRRYTIIDPNAARYYINDKKYIQYLLIRNPITDEKYCVDPRDTMYDIKRN